MLKAPRVGENYQGRKVEATGRMGALIYYCKGTAKVVLDRPLVCTSHDVIMRVDLVHRCGTDVKTYFSGRSDQIDESILAELATALDLTGHGNPKNLPAYYKLIFDSTPDSGIKDPLHSNLKKYLDGLSPNDKQNLRATLERSWGRLLGHELVGTVVKVGSKVKELTKGIGYMEGRSLPAEYLDFKLGERLTVQTRVARYEPPAAKMVGEVMGVQLLTDNIENMAMTLDGGFAQCLRLTPNMIQSRSIIRVPSNTSDVAAALVEPAACLLDSLEKMTHEVGQGPKGIVHKKGVKPGGLTAIIGAGSMALLAGELALMRDPEIEVGGARELVYFVVSEETPDLFRKLLGNANLHFVVYRLGAPESEVLQAFREQYVAKYKARAGREFPGFDDVIVGAGDKVTVATAHKLLTGAGGRVLAFAGTRGETPIESGVWHYGNAATFGSSGCNTKMIEIVLGLLARKSISLEKMSGKEYTLLDLKDKPEKFFSDLYLRPCLAPNKGVAEVKWEG